MRSFSPALARAASFCSPCIATGLLALALTAGCSSGGGGTGSGGSVGTGTGGAQASGGSTGSGGSGPGTGGATSGSGGAVTGSGGQRTGGASSGGATGSGGTSTATGGSSGSGGRTGGTSGSGGAANGGSGTGTGGAAAGGSNGCILCDDFESSTSTVDAAKWAIDTTGGGAVGKAEIVASGAHGSAKAVKVSGGYIKMAAKPGLLASVGSVWYVRLNMKFDMAQPSDHVTYLMFDDGARQLRIGAQNGGMHWNYDSTDSILPDYNSAPMSLKPPANEWHCFEFAIDATVPSLRAWMDGTESAAMQLDKTSTPGIDDRWMRDMAAWKPTITNFAFGSGYPTAGKVTLWVDDIAISRAPIGCTF